MTFNNVNVFRSVLNTLNTSGVNSSSDKVKNGGSFSPNTFEAIAIMRSELDNQWDNSYITKYEALLQTRLNRLKQELNNAYKALLEISGGMHIRDDADATSANKSLQSAYGSTLAGGSNAAFNDLKYYADSAAFNAADGGTTTNTTAVDGIPSYWQADPIGLYEMRRLYVTGPALQIVNDVNITMRTEEIPGKATTGGLGGLAGLLGNKPFIGGEKVAEYSAEVKTGGFWTTVNYLFNFSPREMKYNYVTAYSTTTEEAGTRQKDGVQALLANRQVVDSRDAGQGGMSDPIPVYGSASGDTIPPDGARIKWETTSSSYITEQSPFFGSYGKSIDNRTILRRQVANNFDFQDYNGGSFSDTVRSDFDIAADNGEAKKYTVYGNEEFKNGPMSSRLKWEFQHDGKVAADLNQDGDIDGSDDHTAKAAFVNHYIVQTKTIELNSSADSYGKIEVAKEDLIRSKGVDGTADHTLIDENKNKVIDNILDSDGNPKEKMLMAGSSKISKTFTGEYMASLHTIDSFNGQEISSNNGSIVFNKPVILGQYEGFERAKMMSIGVAEDYIDEINTLPRTKAQALELVSKFQSEINASGMVDTDWHYSQYKDATSDKTTGSKIMFKLIDKVEFDSGLVKIEYDPTKVYSTTPIQPNGTKINPIEYESPTVAFRKTFNLSADEISMLNYSGSLDTLTSTELYIDTPNREYKDARIKINTSSIIGDLDLIVNGKVVPPESPGVYNLKGYLQEGDNVISTQMKFSGNGGATGHYFELLNDASNNPEVTNWINSKISTERAKNGDNVSSKFNSNPEYGYTSAWQSKLAVQKVDINFKRNSGDFNFNIGGMIETRNELTANEYYDIMQNGSTAEKDDLMANWFLREDNLNDVLLLGSSQTATKIKDVNPLLRVLIDALNNPEYKDIFYLGMVNSNLGKNIQLKATVSAPTGGSIEGILDVKYNPKDHRFTLVQSKYDAFGGI